MSAPHSLSILDALAEARIEQAMREGVFDNLPGAGRPLELEDDRLVPEESRVAYRILKNAGFVPPEVEARRERAELVAQIARLVDVPERCRALVKLALLEARLEGSASRLSRERSYEARFIERFSRS